MLESRMYHSLTNEMVPQESQIRKLPAARNKQKKPTAKKCKIINIE